MARIRISIVFESGARIGPGKAKLLESIRDTGSISARDAGRHRERSGHVVRRGTAGPVRQPDAPIRYGVDSDEHSDWGAHDVRG